MADIRTEKTLKLHTAPLFGKRRQQGAQIEKREVCIPIFEN